MRRKVEGFLDYEKESFIAEKGRLSKDQREELTRS